MAASPERCLESAEGGLGFLQQPYQIRRGALQGEFDFVSELDEHSAFVAGAVIPDRVLQEMSSLANRLGQKAARLIEDVLWRECGRVYGADARRVIAAEFLSQEAKCHRSFFIGIGLECHEESPYRYGPGSWRLAADWQPCGPVYVISGIRTPAGDFASIRLEAKAFHRAASVLQAVVRAIGPGDYTKPPASEWSRIWHGGRKAEAGVMAELLAGLRRGGEYRLSVDLKENGS